LYTEDHARRTESQEQEIPRSPRDLETGNARRTMKSRSPHDPDEGNARGTERKREQYKG
jgi:hypothetical protein